MKAKRSPARADLAAAIEKHAQASRERRSNEVARERAIAMLKAAEAALETAQAAVAAAKGEHVARIAEAASVGVDVATAPDLKARSARLDEGLAEDDVAAARAALAGFDAALAFEHDYAGDPLDAVTLAAKDVERRARAVIAAEADVSRMIEEAKAAYAEAAAKRALIVRLVNLDLVDTGKHEAALRCLGGGVLPSLMVRTHGGHGGTVFDAVWPVASPEWMVGVATWTDTLASLGHDADAELPA